MIATDAASAVGYRGAGTIEGLLAGGEYFFLEMNTRVQVEHCVTEMTTGIDIVKTGIRVAAGEPLPFTQDDIELRGHAIECRINAEDAARRFAPAPGRIDTYREPSGPGVRVDSGVVGGSEISPAYDPMIAKLIVWDTDRAAATARMRRALDEFEITGVTTLIPFHSRLLATAHGSTARPAGICSRTTSGSPRPPARQRPPPRPTSRPRPPPITPSRSEAAASRFASTRTATAPPRPAARARHAPRARAARAARPRAAAAIPSPARCRAPC